MERTPPETEAFDLQDPFVRKLDVGCSTIAAARSPQGRAMLEGMTYDLAANYHRYGWHASRSGTIVLETS